MSSHQCSCANPVCCCLLSRRESTGLPSLNGCSCNGSASQHLHFQLLFSTAFHGLENCWREGCAAGRAGVALAAKPPRWSEASAASLPFIPCVLVLTLSTRSASAAKLGAVERVHVAVHIPACYSPQCLWHDSVLFSRTETSRRDWNNHELGSTGVIPGQQ